MAAKPLVALVVFAALLFAGCVNSPAPSGGNGTAPTSGMGAGNSTGNNMSGMGAMTMLEVSTSGQYPVNPGFNPATLSAKAGEKIHLTFTNADTAPVPLIQHNWVLDGVNGTKTKDLNPGEKDEIQFTAPAAGEYKYYCSIGDHRQRGMEGTLTVS